MSKLINPNGMNISRLNIRKLLTPLILFLLPLWTVAQVEYYEVIANESVIHEFASCGNAGQVIQLASNGTHSLNGEEGETYGNAECDANPNVLEYFPNFDFIGLDTMKISYYQDDPIIGPIYTTSTLVFEVVPALVDAVDDYVVTSPGTSIDIDVLSNDESNVNINLSNIPLINYGDAQIVSNQISFTPEAGHEGMAYLNYTICDDANEICDVAKVSIFVQNDDAVNDTTTLVTLKNESILALIRLDNGYQELLEPSNGSLELMVGRIKYTPDNDFVGKDTFSYAYNTNSNTSIATFVIDVLWADDPNNFAVNDYTYCAINTSAALNALDNDLNDNLSVQSFTNGSHGTVTHIGGGNFVYLPNDDFEGLDQFTYVANINGTPSEEEATVYVVVSNQNPESQDFELSTPMNTPLILNYDIPIQNYEFAIIGNNPAVYGEVVYYPGEFSNYLDPNDDPLLVNGQEVDGYNLIIYYPTEEDYLGWDQFEIEYYVGEEVQLVKIDVEMVEIDQPQQDTICVGDCVWAGDANYDGKVDMTDLLPVGYCVGDVGDERINGGVDWYGQYGDNWNGFIGNTPTNIKHVDTDGDGFIGESDTIALSQFYGLYHDLVSEANPPFVDIPLFFVPQTPNPGPGDVVITNIVLGTPSLPAIDLHGLTFALNFNEEIVEPGSMQVNFFNDNWLAYNSTMLSMVKEPYLGRVEAGYTRATGISGNGYGIIGQVSFVITDEIDGTRLENNKVFKTTVKSEVPITMNSAGRFVSISTSDFELNITKPEKEDPNQKQLFVFPNPSNDVVNIHLNGDNVIEHLVVYSLTGQEVYRLENIDDKQVQLQVSDKRFANGMYIISAITEKGVINEKLEVLK